MTHPFDEMAVEAAARGAWNADYPLAPSAEKAVWEKTSEQWKLFLPDKNICDEEDEAHTGSSLQNCTGREHYFKLANAALSAAFKSARDRGMAVDFPESTTAWRVPVTIIRHKENEHD